MAGSAGSRESRHDPAQGCRRCCLRRCVRWQCHRAPDLGTCRNKGAERPCSYRSPVMTAGGLNPTEPTTTRPPTVHRVRTAHVEWVSERLSERDWLILQAVNQLRLITGTQLEHLYFSTLNGHARTVIRGRVLRRLVGWRVLDQLPRRIGGAVRGSSGAVFALGPAGAQLLAERQAAAGHAPRVRQVGGATERTVRHTLAVSELYVQLVTHARAQGAQVVGFAAEP